MEPWQSELCADVCRMDVNWLWPGYVARGKLALLDGDPGVGKSLITLDLIARLSRGGLLPDGQRLPRAYTTILISAEDAASDTIRPRAEAAGADLSRIVLPKFNGRIPRFPADLPSLEALVVERSADLVVIDPLMAFLPPQVAANLDQCVRLALTPLANIAEWTGCAIKAVRHLGKARRDRAILRGQGSMGIVAAARTGLLAGAHPDDPTRRVLAAAKSNLGPAPPVLGYRIVTSPSGLPVIEWLGPVDLTADDVGRRPKREPALRLRDRAIDWLKRELANGPRTSADLFAAAAEAGIPERTLERAKSELPARSHRDWDDRANQGTWYWYDPDAPWPKKAPFRKPYEFPPLPPLGEF